jgi:hypothetical protein
MGKSKFFLEFCEPFEQKKKKKLKEGTGGIPIYRVVQKYK